VIITRPIAADQSCDYCRRPAIAHLWTEDREYVTCGGLCSASRNAAWFVVPLTEYDQCAYCRLRAVALMGRDNDGLGHEPTCGGVCRASRRAADTTGRADRALGITESDQRP